MTEGFKGLYFETQVILVDDNKSFLDTLGFRLSDFYPIDTYSNPFDALDEINSNFNNNVLINQNNFLIEHEDEENDGHSYSVDFAKITDLAAIQTKNQLISVVIVDYSMPLLNGIEFCTKIAHIPILKIMLTGHADFQIAVDAFNKGIIDRFLVKDTPLMLDEIKHGIEVMQSRFFEKYSLPFLSSFSINKDTLVHSSEYREHLNSVIKQHNPIEFYILDSVGSYLLISKDGTHSYFIVLLDQQLNEYIEIATDMNADPDLIKKITQKTHAPIFIDEMSYKLPVSQWGAILKKIQQKNGYHYSIFERGREIA